MREIKFRAWNKIWKMMSNVDKIEFEDGSPISISVTIEATDFDHEDEWKDYEIGEDIELMQYTGLKDKNGREIYEGDIVKIEWREKSNIVIGEIAFSNMTYKLKYHPQPEHAIKGKYTAFAEYWSDGEYDWETLEQIISPEIEIIGNIYENQELLAN